MPLLASCLAASAFLLAPPPAGKIQTPTCKDPALEITLFAREPDIVTPTGIAAAADGALLVIENHTHFPLKDYKGPKFDRILRFTDKDSDGKPDGRNVFADGLKDTMGIAAHPDGSVWVACRHAIYRFVDGDGDGTADQKKEMIRLETKGNYPHNGLSGFVVEPTKFGDLYFGLGENFGEPYKIVGSDGSTQSGGGEGGSVYRCRSDGSNVERFATGFWNPYHGCLDGYGRLFILDNDPDDRPPCRLLHVVLGGDYGYRFRNGRRGIHPFTAWNGELPGTLPMVAGTGEAPSGLVHVASDALGKHNRDVLIGTSWGDHRLERFRLQPRGASFHSQPEPIVTGGEDFRPVGACMDRLGNLWVTDWVDKSYNVHGKGRIWRVRAKQRPDAPVEEHRPYQAMLAEIRRASKAPLKIEVKTESKRFATTYEFSALPVLVRLLRSDDLPVDLATELTHPGMSPELRAEVLRRMPPGSSPATLLAPSFLHGDSFLGQAALVGLARTLPAERARSLMQAPDAAHLRLAGVLIHRMQTPSRNPDWLIPRFEDSDSAVQFAAVQTVGEYRIKSLRPHVVKLLESGKATGRLLLACTAALDDLDRVKKNHGDEFNAGEVLVNFILKPTATPALIREALPFIPANHPKLKIDRLEAWFGSEDAALRRAVVQALRERPASESQPALLKVLAREPSLDVKLEATVGLTPADSAARSKLIELAASNDPPLRREALRSLRTATLSTEEAARLRPANAGDPTGRELLDRLTDVRPPRPPSTAAAAWMERLQGPADPDAGRRVFFHPNGPGCFKCHRVGERGGQAGPDLSGIGGGLTRERLVESILQPSKEVAPMFTPWTLAMSDGTTKTGLYVGGTNKNTQVYVDPNGHRFEVRPEDVEQRKPSPASIMPAELVDAMTDQEFRDLLAFLQNSKRR